MRRICGLLAVLACTAGAWAAPDLTNSITGSGSDGLGNSIVYRLFRPAGYDTPGKQLPLVIFMHGAGERGNNNTSQVNSHIDGLVTATQSTTYASYLLAPQVPAGKQWVDVPWSAGSYTTQPAVSTSMNITISLIENLIATTNIDPKRVYVTGLSMGGFGSWDLISRRPDLIAAAVPMSGGGNKAMGGVIDTIPVWAFHGSTDGTVPVSGTRDMIAAMQTAGGTPRYTEMVGVGHSGWAGLYADNTTYTSNGQLYPWLYSQSLPEPAGMGIVGLAMVLMGRRRKAA